MELAPLILGILSDTHGRAERAGRARRLLERLGATALIHCGDVGGPEVFDEFAGSAFHFVWGNTDLPDALLKLELAGCGFSPPTQAPLPLTIAERRFAVFHGHERAFAGVAAGLVARDAPRILQQLPGVEFVLYGHTHEAADERVGPLRCINPGALHRARLYTVATLDLRDDTVRFWRVDDARSEADPPLECTLAQIRGA